MGRPSIRCTAGLLFGVLALAIGGCGSVLLHDGAFLAQGSHLELAGHTADPVSPIPDLPEREAAPWGPATADLAGGAAVAPAVAAAPPSMVESRQEDRQEVVGSDQSAPGDEVAAAEEPDRWTGALAGVLVEDAPVFVLDLERDRSLELAFQPIRDETLVQVMLGLREWPRHLAQASGTDSGTDSDDDALEYDPWEPFNETMFDFNLKLDRWVLKPVARVWDKVVADELKQMIARGFDNLRSAARIVNSLLQAKWSKAGTETTRFLINSTVGFAGLWDLARQEFGIERPDPEDFGQTLGVWGLGSGPFLVLPVLAPTTVRDILGRVVDGFMNPASYFTPFFASLGLFVGETVNDRALNLELFQGFEETTIDFYSAVRNAYLSRRARQLLE